MNVHLFIGRFKNEEEALAYTQEQWQPEPDDSVSDEEYQQWEDNNPTWKMKEDLGCYLESDFIETINGPEKFDYLKSVIEVSEHEKLHVLKEELDSNDSTLVLIFEEAIQSDNFKMKSTSQINYKGIFKSTV